MLKIKDNGKTLVIPQSSIISIEMTEDKAVVMTCKKDYETDDVEAIKGYIRKKEEQNHQFHHLTKAIFDLKDLLRARLH